MITLTIDDVKGEVPEGTTVLEAAESVEIYIPRLCYHPDLSTSKGLKPVEFVYRGDERIESDTLDQEFEGCQLCVVEIEGMEGFPTSCNTLAEQGMVVRTDTPELQKLRMENLIPFLADHPHYCLTCAQREGCSRTQCSSNVPENERCCPLLGHCEVQKVAEYVGISEKIPKYIPAGLPILDQEPLFTRDYNLCIGCTRCVRACRELRGVEALGFVFKDGRVIVGTTTGPSLSESACKFCTTCVEVCPTGALVDRREAKGAQREAVLVPCRNACPAGIDVPRYVRYIAEGKFDEALAVIREKVPFPSVLGYICTRLCEAECRRGEVNAPIAIRALKRAAAERGNGLWKEKLPPVTPTGKKVAIVGSGPAGLTAAYYLARRGHQVTVFEAGPAPGGTLRTAIPKKRLSREALKQDIEEILQMGVDLQLNTHKTSVDELFAEGFEAVFLGTGVTYVGAPDFRSPKKENGDALKLTPQGSIAVDPETLATSREGVFAGGDLVIGGISEDFIQYTVEHWDEVRRGRHFVDILVDQIALHRGDSSHSVIRVIDTGRRAANAIDSYLGGKGIIEETLIETEEPDPWLGRDEGFADWTCLTRPYSPPPPQLAGQGKSEPPLRVEAAIEEARRCLRCNLRALMSEVVFPPEKWLAFNVENVSTVPDVAGVYQLLDEEKKVFAIKGIMNLRQDLEEQLETNEQACYFIYEEDEMYTKRESELLQQYLQQYGEMPGGGMDELDDLF